MFKKKITGHIIHSLLILFLGWSSIGWIDPLADKIREGNSLYHNGKYDEALDKYVHAQVTISNTPSKEGTSMPHIDFNIADTQYKRGKYEEAAQLFEKGIQSNDIKMKAKSCFNLGNTLYRQGKMKEALEYYKKTLDFADEAGPEDHEFETLKKDAKYNYEYVEKKMKEQQQQQQQNQEQENQQQQEQEEEKKDDKQSEENNDKEEEKKQEPEEDKQKSPGMDNNTQQEGEDNKHSQQPDKDEQKEQPQGRQPEPQDQRQMSKEEAERLLEALNQSEKEARTTMRDAQKLQHRSVEKDW